MKSNQRQRLKDLRVVRQNSKNFEKDFLHFSFLKYLRIKRNLLIYWNKERIIVFRIKLLSSWNKTIVDNFFFISTAVKLKCSFKNGSFYQKTNLKSNSSFTVFFTLLVSRWQANFWNSKFRMPRFWISKSRMVKILKRTKIYDR